MNQAQEISTDRILRVHIVAKLLGYSRRTVRRRIKANKIPAIRIGRRPWGVRVSDLMRFTSNHGVDHD